MINAIHPDSKLLICENERPCRLGLIARDADNRYWGLTARHVFENQTRARLVLPDGSPVGDFYLEDNEFKIDKNDALKQVARFRIHQPALDADKVHFGVTWPRSSVEEAQILGAKIVSIESRNRIIGIITEANSVARVKFRNTDVYAEMHSAVKLTLQDRTLVRPGMAGTLLLSDVGEALAFGIAVQENETGFHVIGAPIRPYLKLSELRPWAPFGAHWSDLVHRADSFLQQARADEGPDLGGAPHLPRGVRA